ncbi:MAG: hypothetical protein ACPGU7_14215 [Gammaproteobacteria bacterium]
MSPREWKLETLVIQPPNCRIPVLRRRGWPDYFALRATVWTDGASDHLPDANEALLLKHPSEGLFFWFDDCEVVVDLGRLPEEADGADYRTLYRIPHLPCRAEYLWLLESGFARTRDYVSGCGGCSTTWCGGWGGQRWIQSLARTFGPWLIYLMTR